MAARAPLALAALLLAAVAAASTAVADGGTACTGGWGCGEMPSGVDEDECAIATKKPCDMATGCWGFS